MGVLDGLKPERVFYYFERLSSVPHGSGNTKAVSDICVEIAKELHLRYIQDEWNNVIVFKDASKGHENAEPVILQGHIDMVLAKTEDNPVDLTKEPIELVVDGEWVRANNTTLGGDNMIAVATAFAILEDDSFVHPAIEALFTVDEEVGMIGAHGVDTSCLRGRTLLNLDSEEEGIFTVGCSGGARFHGKMPVTRMGTSESVIEVVVDGLLGGHSGAEIDKGRGMSHRLMARFLYAALDNVEFRLIDMYGGSAGNAIPDKTTCYISIKPQQMENFMTLVAQYDGFYKNELKTSDPGVRLTARKADSDKAPIELEETRNIVKLLNFLPYGIQAMSFEMPGLVQTSLNMGVIEMEESCLNFHYAVRSCIESQKQELLSRMQGLVTMMGGSCEVGGDYPGWEVSTNSKIRRICQEVSTEYMGKEPVVTAIHAGLECGLLISKMPGLDAVSYGPDLRDIHSPRERLNIKSVERMYDMTKMILERLA